MVARTGFMTIAGLFWIFLIQEADITQFAGTSEMLLQSQSQPAAINFEIDRARIQMFVPLSNAPSMPDKANAGNSHDYWIQRAVGWQNAIIRHTAGDPDEAAVTIGSWPEHDLEVIVCLVKELTNSTSLDRHSTAGDVLKTARLLRKDIAPYLRIADNANSILKRGALLHSDIAMLHLETGMAHTSNPDSKIILANDGRGIPQMGGWHWKLARLLLNSVSPHPSQDEMIGQWYIATAAYMFARRDWGYAAPHLASALKIYPSDAKLLFYAGILHEIYASSSSQNSQLPPGIYQTFASKESELKLALEFLQKAVESNPAFAEAHLHLGHVLGLRGDHDRAIAELEQEAEALSDPQLLYYRSLFIGNELAKLNRPEQARAQFERAAALYPNAQSPLLALSRLARKSGDFHNAQIAIEHLFALPATGSAADDPWWVYDLSHVRNEPLLVSEMRKKFGEIL